MVLKRKNRPRKPKKLRRLFAGYIAVFCVVTILFAALLLKLAAVLLSTGAFLQANFGEKQLSAATDSIKSSAVVTPQQIPDTCVYGVYSLQGRFLYGSFGEKEAMKAWKLTQEQGLKQDSGRFYSVILRQNEICIVRYTLVMQYNSPLLRRFLPYPEIMLFLVFGIGILLEAFLLASSFGGKLSKKMRCLQNATEKIRNQDLDFPVESSGVYEIDNVLGSIEKMKEALKASLQAQWEMEQTRRDQISALAHDIKTPLTITLGNAELLSETALNEEQKVYLGYIAGSARRLEQYVRTLIEISKAETGSALNKTSVDSEAFVSELARQLSALAAAKKINVIVDSDKLPESFSADADLLMRAVMNVAANAVDFSPENEEIHFSAAGKAGTISFCVVDAGKGFSADDLKNATLRFYMGDKSRTSDTHCGMGLFIADTIVRQHGGTLSLSNSAETGGGKVVIEIPV